MTYPRAAAVFVVNVENFNVRNGKVGSFCNPLAAIKDPARGPNHNMIEVSLGEVVFKRVGKVIEVFEESGLVEFGFVRWGCVCSPSLAIARAE